MRSPAAIPCSVRKSIISRTALFLPTLPDSLQSLSTDALNLQQEVGRLFEYLQRPLPVGADDSLRQPGAHTADGARR